MTLFVSLADYRAGRARDPVTDSALSLLETAADARLELLRTEIGKPDGRSNAAPTLATLRLAADAFVFKDLIADSAGDEDDHPEGIPNAHLDIAGRAIADVLGRSRFELHPMVSRALVSMIPACQGRDRNHQYVLATLNGDAVRFDLTVWAMDLRGNAILGPLVDGLVAVTAVTSSLDYDEINFNALKVLIARQRDTFGLTNDEAWRQYQEVAEACQAWERCR